MIFLLLLLLTSCHSPDRPIEGVAMTMRYRVAVGQPLTRQESKQVQGVVDSTFEEVDAIYNNWNPHSEISKINRSAAHKKILLSPELAHFLVVVDEAVTLTEGRFDPSIEPLQQLWKSYLQAGKLPPEERVEELQQVVGWEKFHVEGNQLWKEHTHCGLDFGGIAKGYAIDLITERLLALGYENLYVEWGSEIRTCGLRGDRPWQIQIVKGPVLSLKTQSLATSGDYFQQWTIEGKSYTHIIDPHTKTPLVDAPLASCTIGMESCLWADVMATSCMLFSSKEEAEKWAQEKTQLCHLIDRASWHGPSPASSHER